MQSVTFLTFQKCIISALLAGFFIITAGVAQAAVLSANGFESGDFSAWSGDKTDWYVVNNPAGAHSGDYRAEGRGDGTGTGSVLALYLDTTGYEALSLSFWYQIPDSGFEPDESLSIDYTTDNGANWDNLATFVDGDEVDVWTQLTLAVPAANNSDFGVRFVTNAGSATDIFKLDDVTIEGEEIIVPSDADADGVVDEVDNCPFAPNPSQADFDVDGEGDVCDNDIDGDGIPNELEYEGCEYSADLQCGVENLDEDNDGVGELDICPATTVDVAGSSKLNANHWRYNGTAWLRGERKGKTENSSIYTMSDTRGCSCDQILSYMSIYTGESYGGQQKFGCTSGTIEEFMSLVW